MKTKLNRTRILNVPQSQNVDWKSLSLILFLVLFSIIPTIKAQTNLPDNIVDADCYVAPPATVWSIAPSKTNEANLSTYQIPIVGDIDGDGIAEIIVGGDLSEAQGTSTPGNLVKKIYIYKGNDLSSPPKSFSVIEPFRWNNTTKYSIVKTKIAGYDTSLIVVAEGDRYLRAYNHNGVLVWTSDAEYHVSNNNDYGPCFADMNNDGIPEIIISGKIFDSTDGKLLCDTGKDGHTISADINHNGKLVLIVGNSIYEPNAALTSTSLVRTISGDVDLSDPDYLDPITISEGTYPIVADMDKDGKLDLIVSTLVNRSSGRYTFISISDPTTGVIKVTKYIPEAGVSSYPFVGDIDGDGLPEIVIIKNRTGNFGREDGISETIGDFQHCQMIAYKYAPGNPVLQEFWSYQHYDYSGRTGMTLFDFNLDGISEIVYRDEWNVRIINGSGKHHITGEATGPYNLASFPNHSGTSMEYPVVADVDGDGQAEILIVGAETNNDLESDEYFEYSGALWMFKSEDPTNNPWAPARKVWNQYLYNVVNINEDLTVPATQFNPATIFAGDDGILGTPDDIQPFNNFLQQQTTLSEEGVSFWFAARAKIGGTTTFSYDGSTDLMTVTVPIDNAGRVALQSPFYITAYRDNMGNSVKHTHQHSSMILPGETAAVSFNIPNFRNSPWQSSSGTGIAVRINDNGNGYSHQVVCDSINRDVNTTQLLFAAPDYAETIGNTSVTTTSVIANDNLLPGCNTPVITVAPKHGMAELIGNQIKYTPSTNYAGKDTLTYTVSCTSSNGSIIKASAPVYINVLFTTVDITVFLQGALQDNGTMRNTIQQHGGSTYPNLKLPTTDPYGLGTLCDTINNITKTGAVVDWVKVEIRKASDPKTILEERALLLRPNGKIVDLKGNIPEFIPRAESIYIAVRHRNHLSVASTAISPFTGNVSHNFSTGSANNNGGTIATPMTITYGKYCMWAGDVNGNDRVDSTDTTISQSSFNSSDVNNYIASDVTLNGATNSTDATVVLDGMNNSVYSPLFYWK